MTAHLFDFYAMADWSACNRRRSGRQDCLWVAHGWAKDHEPVVTSPASRSEAESHIRELLLAVREHRGRALVCADFPYGYPAGFSTLLPAASSGIGPAWRRVWQHLAGVVRDDLDTGDARLPSNRSNRFHVASEINSHASGFGPFWCSPRPTEFRHIPQCAPVRPFRTPAGVEIAPARLADTRAHAGTPFRLYGTGSVGSQALTGIPRIASLRFDPVLSAVSGVWPFETGWATSDDWPSATERIIHAEIYPSVRPPLPDSIRDRGQVRAMWHWARVADEEGSLWRAFSIPAGVIGSSDLDLQICSEEGWILGCT